MHAGTDHDAVKTHGFGLACVLDFHSGGLPVGCDIQHLVLGQELHTQTLTSRGQANGVFVDVAGGIAFGEIDAVVLALQGGLDGFHFLGRHGAA